MDAEEFKACLKATSLGLQDNNIESLILEADENDDTTIDYDVSHFSTSMHRILTDPWMM